MSATHDMHLIVRYFGRVATTNGAAALKAANPSAAAESSIGTQVVGGLSRSNSAAPLSQMLGTVSMNASGTQMRSLSTAVSGEAVSAFELQRFGKPINSPAVDAALAGR